VDVFEVPICDGKTHRFFRDTHETRFHIRERKQNADSPADSACQVRSTMHESFSPGRTILYLIRHGATENNLSDPPRLQGSGVDLPLSVEGLEQAKRAAELMCNLPIRAVIASPLRRAQQTAECIASACGLVLATEPDLREVDVGAWEQRSWVEIAQTEPEAYRNFQLDPGTHGYRGGENFQQVRDRALPALEKWLQTHRGSHLVVVGHNIVNRVLIAHAMGLSFSQARPIHLDNGGISVFHYEATQLRLLTLNSAFHLSAS
jgi:broad specificity phosphatase PhoE